MAGETTSTSSASANLRTMVYQLMANDRKPLERLQAQKSELQSRGTAFQSLGTRISSLQTLASKLSLASAQNPLRTLRVSGPDADRLVVTADGSADPGDHTVEVLQLAARQTLSSDAMVGDQSAHPAAAADGGDGAAGSGAIRFRLTANGETREYSVELEAGATRADALAAIAEAINGDDGAVRAAVLERGGGMKSLLLRATETGAAAQVTQIEDVEGNWMRALGLAGSADKDGVHAATVEEGKDALLRIDGVEVHVAGNTLSDVLPGVSLNLKAAGGSAMQVRIERDPDTVVSQIRSFIEEFNATVNEVRTKSQAADDSGSNRGIFAGDLVVSRLRMVLRTAAASRVTLASGNRRSLADLGITTDREGRLVLSNEKMLRATVEGNPALVEELLAGTGGVAYRLTSLLGTYSRTGGILGRETTSIRSRIKQIDGRVERTNENLARREAQLTSQLANLQSAIGVLTQQKEYLSGLLASSDALF